MAFLENINVIRENIEQIASIPAKQDLLQLLTEALEMRWRISVLEHEKAELEEKLRLYRLRRLSLYGRRRGRSSGRRR